MDFTIHSKDSAPAPGKPLLQKSLDTYGFIPNLHGVMAEAPALLEAYQTIGGLWAKTELSVLERQIVLMTINRVNECHYCMAAHSMIATMEKMPADILDALRAGSALADPKLEALRRFTETMVETRGWANDAAVQALLDAGYAKATVLEIVLGISYKVMSNYVNHLAETALDTPFQAHKWGEVKAKAA